MRRAVATLTNRVEDSLSWLPPEVYDLVKSITLCAVGERSLTLHESQVAMVVEKVFEFNKDLSKFQDCSEAVRTLARQGVSDIFGKNPIKRSTASHEVNTLQPSPGGTNGSVNGNAPSAADASLGLLAGLSTSQGDNNFSVMGPDDVDGDIADPFGVGAMGDRTLGLSTGENVGVGEEKEEGTGCGRTSEGEGSEGGDEGSNAVEEKEDEEDGVEESEDDEKGASFVDEGEGMGVCELEEESRRPTGIHGERNGSVDGNAPSAADASLGLSAGWSTSQRDEDVSGMGPNDVDGDVEDPDDGASADRTLGLLTGGNVGPQPSPGGTNGSVNGNAPSAADASLGLSAGLSTLQGDNNFSAMGPDDVDGDIADPFGVGAMGDRTLGLSTGENVGPQASPGGTNGSAEGCDAPLTIAVDVGPAADGHVTTEEDVGGANASSSSANVAPVEQLTRLYPYFNHRIAGSGQ